MRVSRGLLVVIVAILTASCGATLVPYAGAELEPLAEVRGQAQWEVARAVERAAVAYVQHSEVPGVQVALRFGDFAYAGAYGHRDSRRAEFVRVDDIYRVGSVTKTFTAVVVLSLVQDGRLSLDDPVEGWVDLPRAQGVTVRQLLNHSSGIPDYTERTLPNLASALRPRRQWRPEQLVARVRRQELLFEPGSRYAYSNTNYVALGMIAESVSGRSLAELYRERIIERAELRDTWFLPYEEGPDAGRLVIGYERDILPLGVQAVRPRNRSWLTYGYAAGAMVSTAEDLVRFADALFDGRLINGRMLDQMTQFIDAPDPDVAAQTGYGLGLRRLDSDGTLLIGHTGTTPGFGAVVMHAPGADYTVAAVGNLSRLGSVELLQSVLGELRGASAWHAR
ncbi:MAG: class A beta-lactamase-related serine hydrolase [Spirochaetaceae bacterium]|nr:MAG: class A beta-lactamase-related serine hydrolase [Spirochaetaceae bacterium]